MKQKHAQDKIAFLRKIIVAPEVLDIPVGSQEKLMPPLKKKVYKKGLEVTSFSSAKLTRERFDAVIAAAEEILNKRIKEVEGKEPTDLRTKVYKVRLDALNLLKEFEHYGQVTLKQGIDARSISALLGYCKIKAPEASRLYQVQKNDLAYVVFVGLLKEAEAAAASSALKLVEGAEIVTITNKNIKPKFWGTAGCRGNKEDPDDFSIDNIRRQIAGFAEEALERVSKGEYTPINGKTISVAFAYDSRKDSDNYAYEMAKVLAAYEGFEVDILDEALPTPIVARLTKKERPVAYDFAFHLTPSHNQLQYGGIKLLFEGSVNEHMWTYFFEKKANAKMEYPINPKAQLKKVRIVDQLIKEYLDEVFPSLAEKFKAFRSINPEAQFIVDLMDGSMTNFAPLFERWGMKVVRKGQMKDIDYSARVYELAGGKKVGFAPDPTQPAFYKEEPEYQKFLKEAPDGSIYFLIDGDGDRLVTLIKKSSEPDGVKTIKPNQFGPLAFDYILSNKLIPEMKRLVRTYVTSAGVDAVAKYHGLADPLIVPVGSKYFNRYFHEAGGLEESGHFVVPGYFDDTIYQLGLILTMMSDTKKDLFTLVDEMQKRTGYKGIDKRYDFENLSPELKAKFIEPLVGTPEEVKEKSQKAVNAIVEQSGKELLEALVVVEGEHGVGKVVKLEEYVGSLFTDKPLVIEANNKGIIVRFKDLSWGGARLSGTGNTGRIYTEGKESEEERKKIADAFINTLDLRESSSPLEDRLVEDYFSEESPKEFAESYKKREDTNLGGSQEVIERYGGIDLKSIQIEIEKQRTLSELEKKSAIAEIKAALAVDALWQKNWDGLAYLYFEEVRLMLEDKIIPELKSEDKFKLISVGNTLQERGVLSVDTPAYQFLQILKNP
ncbi:MAG: hypothetical protein NC828_06185 [Candidatus Omnitrophica bacterium]|nr:hypothetical protein [Candidatus Omnitrophota bacterium]